MVIAPFVLLNFPFLYTRKLHALGKHRRINTPDNIIYVVRKSYNIVAPFSIATPMYKAAIGRLTECESFSAIVYTMTVVLSFPR